MSNPGFGHRSRASSRRAFSLVEVVVALTLTGIVAGLALPRIDVTRYKADAVVTAVRSVFQQAQRASLVGQHDVIISFDLSGNRMRVVWDADNDHAIAPSERVEWKPLTAPNKFAIPTAGVKGTVATSIVGPTLRQMDGMPTVTFHRDGSLSSDLEIYVQGVAGAWRAVTVIQATGRTDWYRRGTNGKWSSGAL